MSWYKENNILPGTLLNFAVLLGWHRKNAKSDFMSLEEMVNSVSAAAQVFLLFFFFSRENFYQMHPL
jgi:glutamyl/glutaminyl-tRNA synthetase